MRFNDELLFILVVILISIFMYIRGKKSKSFSVFFGIILSAAVVTLYYKPQNLYDALINLFGWFFGLFIIWSIIKVLTITPISQTANKYKNLANEYDNLIKDSLKRQLKDYEIERLTFLSDNIEEIRAMIEDDLITRH
jgi:hypothetical protein